MDTASSNSSDSSSSELTVQKDQTDAPMTVAVSWAGTVIGMFGFLISVMFMAKNLIKPSAALLELAPSDRKVIRRVKGRMFRANLLAITIPRESYSIPEEPEDECEQTGETPQTQPSSSERPPSPVEKQVHAPIPQRPRSRSRKIRKFVKSRPSSPTSPPSSASDSRCASPPLISFISRPKTPTMRTQPYDAPYFAAYPRSKTPS